MSDVSSVALVGNPTDTAQNWVSSVLYHQLAVGGERVRGHIDHFSSYLEARFLGRLRRGCFLTGDVTGWSMAEQRTA